jgi:8-oxo-dGTP pyrophosphatase MutT (NUDIX family)
MLNNCNRPHIAVAVIIHDKMQNSILMGRRKVYILKFHPYFLILQDCGLYALPGGHLEKFESF